MSIEFNNLKLYRKESGLTQEQVAEKLNVSRQAVAKWENGEFEGEELEISDPHLTYIPRGFKLPVCDVLPAAGEVRRGTYALKGSERHLCRFFIPFKSRLFYAAQ